MTFCVISIHGASPAVHDAVLEIPGAFDKVLAAMGHLKSLKIPLVLNFVMTRPNFLDLPSFVQRFGPDPSVVELQAYLPHYDGLMNDHADALTLSLKDARPVLDAAVLAAKASGADAKLKIGNAPPCLLPVHRERLFNWEREEENRVLVDPAGMEGGEFREERRDRVKLEPCRSCALEPRCLGFERGYADRFGAAGAVPVAR
jgi:MoaA/NifB/PqqE/SkfB family radical SAM enzyme